MSSQSHERRQLHPRPSRSTSAPTSTWPRCSCRTAWRSPSRVLPEEVQAPSASPSRRSRRHLAGRQSLSRPTGAYDQLYSEQLRHDPAVGRAGRASRASATSPSSARAITACGSGSTRRSSPSRDLTASDVVNGVRSRTCRWPPAHLGQPPVPARAGLPVTRSSTLGRLTDPRQFGESSSRPAPTAAWSRVHDVGRVELGARITDQTCYARRQAVGRACDLPAARLERPRRGRAGQDDHGRAEASSSRRPRVRHRLRHDAVHQRVDPRGVQTLLRGRASSSRSWSSSSSRPGGPRSCR